MGKLDGKVALVTGGTSGIGLATAEEFVKEGAYVFITGRRKPELDAAVRRIGKNVTGIQGDTSKLADLDKLFAQIKKEKGTLDVIFANAGGGTFLKLGEITEEQYQETFDVNVKGVIFTVQKALPLLKDGSSIILNASIVATKGMESFSVYSATKAAVRNLARGFTVDLKSRNIRVNAVSPGPFVTEGFKGLVTDEAQLDAFVKGMSAQIPAGRTGNVEELAKSVVFLASDDSSYIRAANLVVDGGFSQV